MMRRRKRRSPRKSSVLNHMFNIQIVIVVANLSICEAMLNLKYKNVRIKKEKMLTSC